MGHVFGVIAGGRIDDLGGGAQGVEDRAGAASAAADQADFDFEIRAFGMNGVGEGKLACRRGGCHGQRRILEESAAREAGLVLLVALAHGRECSGG